MQKHNFTMTLPPSGAAEAELRDDTPLNSTIAEAELHQSFSSGASGVAIAELHHDNTP